MRVASKKNDVVAMNSDNIDDAVVAVLPKLDNICMVNERMEPH